MELPSGTITFLFTDIVGSTRLWEAHPQEMRRVLADHERLLRAVFERHSGYVFATGGDSFSVAFTTPDEAVRAALDGQQALAEGPFGAVGGLPVRMAIHTGLTEERDGDYFGPPLNQVARMVEAAEGGRIVVSQTVANLVRYALPEGVELRDLGKVPLKDVSIAEHLWEITTEARGARRRWPWLAAGGAAAAILLGVALVVFLPGEVESTTTTTQETATTSTSTSTTAAATAAPWLWMAEIEGEPLGVNTVGNSVYVAYRADQTYQLAAFDAYTGVEEWTYQTIGPVLQVFTDDVATCQDDRACHYLYVVTSNWLEVLHPNGQLVPGCSTRVANLDGVTIGEQGLYVLRASSVHFVENDPPRTPCLQIRASNVAVGMGAPPTFGPSLARNMVVAGDSLGLYGLDDRTLTELWRYPESGLLPVKGVHAEHRQQAFIQGRVDENVVLVFSDDTDAPSNVWNLTRLDPDLPPNQMVVGSLAVAPRPQVVTHRDWIGVFDPTGDLVFYDLDLQEVAWDPESGPVDVVATTDSHVVVATSRSDGEQDPPGNGTRIRWLQPGHPNPIHEEAVPGGDVFAMSSSSDLIHLLTSTGSIFAFPGQPGDSPDPDPFVSPVTAGLAPDPIPVVEGFYQALSSGDLLRTYRSLTAGALVRVRSWSALVLWDGPIVQTEWETHVQVGGLLNAQWTPTGCDSSERPPGFPGQLVECQVTYTNDVMATAGADPVTEDHSFAVYNGLIYEFFEPLALFGDLSGPFVPGIRAYETWLEGTYPEDRDLACRGVEMANLHLTVECAQFLADHLAEWAASLQD